MTTRNNKQAHSSDPRTNPCIQEAASSRKCMDDNHYVREKCTAFFEDYRACFKFWLDIQRERRVKGIKPHMPEEKEREFILQERIKGRRAVSAKHLNQTKNNI